MDGQIPSTSVLSGVCSFAASGSSAPSSSSSPPKNLRSSVSMFIEDSRITAVANAEPPLTRPYRSRVPSSFYSGTSFSSTSGPSSPSTSVPSRRASWNLRPTFRQIPESGHVRPRAFSSSPVRFPTSGATGGSSRGSSGSREIIHNIIREGVEESDGDSPRQQFELPPSHSTARKRTTLNVEPVISVINVKERLPPLPQRLRDDRAYTSVNLTLRSPSISGGSIITSSSPSRVGSVCAGSGAGRFSSDMESGASVNVVNTVVDMTSSGRTTFRHVHSSTPGGIAGSGSGEIHHRHHHAPTNLTYSTYSNSSDGFEAQVQIQFGPGGGTFTASRRKQNHNISIRQMNSDLLSAQSERKEKLRTSIKARHRDLAKLHTEIAQLRSQLQQKSPFTDLEKLKKENQRLRIQCDFMAREVDLYQNGSVPLGETDEEFYQGINPGQSIDALFGITNNRRKVQTKGSLCSSHGQPPPRPPPPKFSPTRSLQSPTMGDVGGAVGGEVEEGGEWACSICTFQNHRDLDYCEQCQMIRTRQPQSHHGPSRGEQNIRIRVVRHPREQQQQRRVVHSWVM